MLDSGVVLAHPWVTGELALGHLRQRDEVIGLLNCLPQATPATAAEILVFTERNRLHGIGIGYVDAQLLAATKLTPDTMLWTKDRCLAEAASRLGTAFHPRAQAD